MTTHRVPALLDALAQGGHVEDRQAVETFVLARQGETELALHIRFLVGIAAVIACACFVGFLWQVGLIDIDEPTTLLISGGAFIVAAIVLNRVSGTAQTAISSLGLQASLATMVAGKLLILYGCDVFATPWAVSLAALMFTVATHHLFRMSIDRFLSSFILLLSVTANLLSGGETALPRELLMTGFFGVQLAAAAVLLTHGRVRREYLPLAYALTFSLCATVLYPGAYNATYPLVVNAFLAGGLIALFAWAGGGIDTLRRTQIVLASLGIVLLGLISAPALMLSIGLLTIGYAKHERPLLILGALLIPAFLWSYYYSTDVSLLTKSVILAASGIALLAGRVYLSYTGRSNAA